MISYYIYDSPIGRLYIIVEKNALIKITQDLPSEDIDLLKTDIHLEVMCQLKDYFQGTRKTFDLPLKIEGSLFSLKVYQALKEVPYGKTITYGELAKSIKEPNASRAVGGALNKNPIMIVLPCHRVIGKNQALVGFRGGLALKKTLLDLEKKNMV